MKKLILFIIIFQTTLSYSQFFESFENTSGPDEFPSTNWALSSGNWAVFDNGIGLATNRWKIYNEFPSNPPYVYSGINCAYVTREISQPNTTTEEYLSTPLLTIPTDGKLSFYSRTFTGGVQGTKYQIRIAPSTGSQTNPSDYILLQEYTENNIVDFFNVYKENIIDLSIYSGQQIYIAFVKVYNHSNSDLSGDRWLLDNVSVQSAPTCEKPTNIVLENSTSTTATISWMNSGSATSWEVIALPTGNEVINSSSTGIITSSNPYTITNLDPFTYYSIYVRAVCTSNDTSNWSTALFTSPVQLCSSPVEIITPNVTSTSVGLNWIELNNATTWEIIAIPEGSPPPTYLSTGYISVNTNPFILNGLNSQTCYAVYIRTVCSSTSKSSWSFPVNVCLNDCLDNGTCGNINLFAFLDSNNNGIKDNDEVDFNQGNFVYQVNNSGDDLLGFTNNGNYMIFDNNTSNNYNIAYAIASEVSNYYSCSTTYSNINLVSENGNYFYFPIVLNQSYLDASVNLYNVNSPAPGFQYKIRVVYSNNGNQTIPSGIVTFTKDANLSILSISESGTIANTNGFTFNFTNLLPFETRLILITFQMPTIPTVSLGQLVTNSISINVANDENTSNNSSSLTQVIVGSYDPNDISESHGEKIVYSNFTTNDYLYYTIRFENTGTANTQFISVENTLDSKLDETTFELVNASHEVNVLADNSNLKFRFLNINLPPTSTQPNDSHGYITYKIKPKPEYAIGDIIPNFANIYFDYNPAITTNTFNTEFVETLANSTFNENDFAMYPNPANNLITINLINNAETINSVTIYDVFGKKIKEINSNSSANLSVDVANLSQGVYVVELETESSLIIKKKLIKE